jgi:FKBP-type peptidyl-prolyl cis-trans isomerase SlyD
MTDERETVADDMVVGLEYTLRLENGDVVDSSAGREPLEYLQGHGQIIPGLEKELYGMSEGEQKDVVVEPTQGYGERRADAYREFPKDAFPAGVELEPGTGIQLRDQSGQPHLAFVAEVRPETVLVDLNHPLAGETLHFDVEVASLRQATDEELAHGHVH